MRKARSEQIVGPCQLAVNPVDEVLEAVLRHVVQVDHRNWRQRWRQRVPITVLRERVRKVCSLREQLLVIRGRITAAGWRSAESLIANGRISLRTSRAIISAGVSRSSGSYSGACCMPDEHLVKRVGLLTGSPRDVARRRRVYVSALTTACSNTGSTISHWQDFGVVERVGQRHQDLD